MTDKCDSQKDSLTQDLKTQCLKGTEQQINQLNKMADKRTEEQQ